jgi:hypothetical protein
MGKRRRRSFAWLSQRLLTKSVSMALQDPVMSMKLASLAMKAWLRYGGDFNPYAALKVVRRSQELERREMRRLPPRAGRKPEPVEDEDEKAEEG